MNWLPQNDLLAHKDIKAFVSHVGQHSLYESAYHGVPLVAFPLYGDQQSNAKKAQHFGLGLAVNFKTSNAQHLFETIERVISERRYPFVILPLYYVFTITLKCIYDTNFFLSFCCSWISIENVSKL